MFSNEIVMEKMNHTLFTHTFYLKFELAITNITCATHLLKQSTAQSSLNSPGIFPHNLTRASLHLLYPHIDFGKKVAA